MYLYIRKNVCLHVFISHNEERSKESYIRGFFLKKKAIVFGGLFDNA